MIYLKKVTKYYNKKPAVDSLTFRIKKGEVVGLLGPNGAGKTTTMRVIVGYITPNSGYALVDNLNPTAQDYRVHKLVGYLPENNPLWDYMFVQDYLRFISDAKSGILTSRIIRETGIQDILFSRIESLSRGMKQRVGLAAAMIGRPKVLVLDEPTSGLDPIEQEAIRGAIKKMKKKKTVILSTHILSEVEAVCDRVLILYNGRLVYDGPVPKKRRGLEKLFIQKAGGL